MDDSDIPAMLEIAEAAAQGRALPGSVVKTDIALGRFALHLWDKLFRLTAQMEQPAPTPKKTIILSVPGKTSEQ